MVNGGVILMIATRLNITNTTEYEHGESEPSDAEIRKMFGF